MTMMSIWHNLPRDLVPKILGNVCIPIETRMELQRDIGCCLVNKLEVSQEMKGKLGAIIEKRRPRQFYNGTLQLYNTRNGNQSWPPVDKMTLVVSKIHDSPHITYTIYVMKPKSIVCYGYTCSTSGWSGHVNRFPR